MQALLTGTLLQATGLRTAIHRAIVEATNDEVQRIRDLEAQLAHIQAGGPIIVCDKTGVRLKVWHPEQARWYETSLIACGPVVGVKS